MRSPYKEWQMQVHEDGLILSIELELFI